MLLDVHMHRPHTTSRNFMDALLAFWPGLQVWTTIENLSPAHMLHYYNLKYHQQIKVALILLSLCDSCYLFGAGHGVIISTLILQLL